MRTPALALALALLSLPSLAAAQQWPTVSGQITVQAPPPPPPPQPVYAQPAPQPMYIPSAPPPPPPGYAPIYPTTPAMQPRLNYNLVYGPEPVTTGARVQLIVGQSINGMVLGLSLAGIINPDSDRRGTVYTGAMLLGGGVGAVTSLLLTRDGITPGQASAINYGTAFGGLGAMFTGFGLSRSDLTERGVWGLVAGGLALGTGAGVAWASQRPLSGRVEFAASMGLWSAFVATHLYLATGGYGTWDSSSRDQLPVLGWSSLGVMAAGLTAGILLSPSVHVSAARMRWINLTAAGGWVAIGLSSLMLAADSSGNDAILAYSIGSIVGVGGGAVLGYFLTQDTDTYWERMHEGSARRRGPTLSFAPGGPGGSPGASLVGTF